MNEAYMKKIFGLDGKTAVVTGSSSGIGQAIAESLANLGAHVAVLGRSQQGIEQTCARIRDNGTWTFLWRMPESMSGVNFPT